MFFRYGYYTMNHAMCPPFVPIIFIFVNKLVELFYHGDTVHNGSVPQVVVDNTRNRVVYDISDYDLVFFHWNDFFGIPICCPMSDTWQLIGGLLPIILTRSSSKDDYLPCSSIFLEGFDELFHWFDELFCSLSSIFVEGFNELFHGFDELFHSLLLLLLKLAILNIIFFHK